VRASVRVSAPASGAGRAIVGRDLGEPPYFRAVITPAPERDGVVQVSEDACAALGVAEGGEVSILPLPRSGKSRD
jgi:arginine/ornithine N-succinyltransferase beta subunit